jgi:hypothetical protein
VTKPKSSSKKPAWFDDRKYRDKSKLTLLQWYWELMIRKSYLDEIKTGSDIRKLLSKLRKNTFATLGSKPIIRNSQLMSILEKDIWSEMGYKSHSARLSTCLDVFDLEIREDIREDCEDRYHVDSHLRDTPIDLQYFDIHSLRYAHLTIDLAAPNAVLKEDIWKIVETLKKNYGTNTEIITSNKRNWSSSNVLEHIDLHLAELEQEVKFKPEMRCKWLPPNSNSARPEHQVKASTREKEYALELLDDKALQQLYTEIYSAAKKGDLDRG